MIRVESLSCVVQKKKTILADINFSVDKGSFVAVVGENGAGKTTLLDLLMGFRKPTSGKVFVMDEEPWLDPWEKRARVAYLSEKIDFPGDWSVSTLLEFNRFFYPKYSVEREKELAEFFRVDVNNRIGNLSAGEIRRAQIVAALSIQPELIIVDEVTAVLDIDARRKFLALMQESQAKGITIILATNIPEGLDRYVSHILLIHRGEMKECSTVDALLKQSKDKSFEDVVSDIIGDV